jgi:hypothetical protein
MKSRNIERARKPSLNKAAHNRQLAHGSRSASKSISAGRKLGAISGHRVRTTLIGCNQRLS